MSVVSYHFRSCHFMTCGLISIPFISILVIALQFIHVLGFVLFPFSSFPSFHRPKDHCVIPPFTSILSCLRQLLVHQIPFRYPPIHHHRPHHKRELKCLHNHTSARFAHRESRWFQVKYRFEFILVHRYTFSLYRSVISSHIMMIQWYMNMNSIGLSNNSFDSYASAFLTMAPPVASEVASHSRGSHEDLPVEPLQLERQSALHLRTRCKGSGKLGATFQWRKKQCCETTNIKVWRYDGMTLNAWIHKHKNLNESLQYLS